MKRDINICHCGKEKNASVVECGDCSKISREWLYLSFKKANTNLYQREARCWHCKTQLSTTTHLKCPICNWIKCTCGACDCNYNKVI